MTKQESGNQDSNSSLFLYLGVHNIVHNDKEWFHLLFYDIDEFLPVDMMRGIARLFSINKKLSYVCYTTKKGYHLAFLTPLTARNWGSYMDTLHGIFHNFYSGHTLRLDYKKNEKQELISYEDKFTVASQPARFYEQRFKLKFPRKIKTKAVYEKYWSPDG